MNEPQREWVDTNQWFPAETVQPLFESTPEPVLQPNHHPASGDTAVTAEQVDAATLTPGPLTANVVTHDSNVVLVLSRATDRVLLTPPTARQLAELLRVRSHEVDGKTRQRKNLSRQQRKKRGRR